jgi:hypothetical protein
MGAPRSNVVYVVKASTFSANGCRAPTKIKHCARFIDRCAANTTSWLARRLTRVLDADPGTGQSGGFSLRDDSGPCTNLGPLTMHQSNAHCKARRGDSRRVSGQNLAFQLSVRFGGYSTPIALLLSTCSVMASRCGLRQELVLVPLSLSIAIQAAPASQSQ